MLPRELLHLLHLPALMRATPQLWQTLSGDPLTWRQAPAVNDAIARFCPEAERFVKRVVFVDCVEIAVSRTMLAKGMADGITFYDAATLTQLSRFDPPLGIAGGRMEFSADGARLLVYTSSEFIVYHVEQRFIMQHEMGLEIVHMAFYDEGVACRSGMGSIHVWRRCMDLSTFHCAMIVTVYFASTCYYVHIGRGVTVFDYRGAVIRRVDLVDDMVLVYQPLVIGRDLYFARGQPIYRRIIIDGPRERRDQVVWRDPETLHTLHALNIDTGVERRVLGETDLCSLSNLAGELAVHTRKDVRFRGVTRAIPMSAVLYVSERHLFYRWKDRCYRHIL